MKLLNAGWFENTKKQIGLVAAINPDRVRIYPSVYPLRKPRLVTPCCEALRPKHSLNLRRAENVTLYTSLQVSPNQMLFTTANIDIYAYKCDKRPRSRAPQAGFEHLHFADNSIGCRDEYYFHDRV